MRKLLETLINQNVSLSQENLELKIELTKMKLRYEHTAEKLRLKSKSQKTKKLLKGIRQCVR